MTLVLPNSAEDVAGVDEVERCSETPTSFRSCSTRQSSGR